MSDIGDAYAAFLLAMMGNKPRDLRGLNSPAALEGRVCDMEAHILAFAQFIEAEIEDTAQHCHLTRREADYAKGVLQDLASDTRGVFLRAIEGVAA